MKRFASLILKYSDVLLGAAGVLALAFFWWMNLKYAGHAATFFDCPSNDGCFQVFNPLRRLAAGQSIGSDFQFFYGPGSILLHYPLFKAYGADLLASETVRILITPLAFMVTTFVFLRVLSRRAGLAFFLTGAACLIGMDRFFTAVAADNSMFGLRAAVPVAAAALLLYAFRERKADALSAKKELNRRPASAKNRLSDLLSFCRRNRFIFALGAMAAIAIFISPDQGAAMVLAATLVLMFMSDSIAKAMKITGCFIATAAIGTVALYGLAAGPELFETLRFHFIETPSNQLWYFGVPPQNFLYSWTGLYRYLWLVVTGEVAILLTLGAFITRGRLGRGRASAVAYLCIYGLLSCVGILGYFKSDYVDVLRWCLLLCTVIIMTAVMERISVILLATRSRIVPFVRISLALAVAIMAAHMIFSFALTTHIDDGMNDIRSRSRTCAGRTQVLGVTFENSWSYYRNTVFKYLDEKRPGQDDGIRFWSTYSGTTEAELGIFSPDTDYIIHTLSKERRAKYAESFTAARPDVVMTTDPWLLFNEWLWQSHWDFFEQVATDYDYREWAWRGSVWTRRDETADVTEEWSDAWVTGGGSMAIMRLADTDDRNIWTVRLRYETNNPWKAIPLIGGMPRFFVWAEGGRNPLPVSLPPRQDELVFPVFTEGDSPIWLKTDVRSLLPGARLRIISAEFRKSPIPKENIPYFFRKARLECREERGFIRCDDLLPPPDDDDANMEGYPRAGGQGDNKTESTNKGDY